MQEHIYGRVLVVEDDSNLLEGIRAVLELGGYEVITAENGKQALDRLHHETSLPDLIVSDIMMPIMDGLELLKEVRSVRRWVRIPFIFLTARSEPGIIFQGKELGVDDYLMKPFDADHLLVAVRSRLDRHRDLMDAEVESVSAIKRRILTILNHEFRTPLTFVVAYAGMLNDSDGHTLTNDEILTFLKGVNSGASRLRRLIENFIHLVEMETGEAKRTYELRKTKIVHLAETLQDVRYQVFHSIETVNGEAAPHACSVQVSDNLRPFVGDLEYFKLAVTQLLENAIKFSPPNSQIVMGAHTVDGEVCVWVRDQGRGIPETEQVHIWDVFYQIDRDYYEDQGAGSGLALVRSVMELHGGRACVESKLGAGSTFSLYFPALAD